MNFDLISQIVNNGYTIINTITFVVTVCSAIAAITPTKKDNVIIGKYLLPIVNAFALNIGNAKNKE